MGIHSRIFFAATPMKGRLMSVSISPGAIAFTVTPWPASSLANERVPPGRFDGLQSLLGAVVLLPIVDADRRTGAGQPFGDRASDASRRPGHDGHPAGQINAHRHPRISLASAPRTRRTARARSPARS